MSDKSEKKSNKVQGTHASSQSLSQRGMGSSYANAVGSIMEQATQIKGSKTGFLGVPTKTIDPRQFSHSLENKNKGDK